MRQIINILYALLVAFMTNMPARLHAQFLDPDSVGDGDHMALVAGYVNKQWISKVDGRTIHENLWGRTDRYLHGFQVGLAFTPRFRNGLGLYTGAMFEIYMSDSHDMGYDNFTEYCLYVPFHANINVWLSRSVALNLHGGLGLNWSIRGSFTNDDAWRWEYDSNGYPYRHQYELDHIRYGHDGWPKAYNAQAELACGIRIRHVLVNASYAWGLIDHNLYRGQHGSDTSQNKMSLSIALGF